MKYFAFGLCMCLAFVNCIGSVWEHNIPLAGAWASSFFGWASVMFANLSLDDERKSK